MEEYNPRIGALAETLIEDTRYIHNLLRQDYGNQHLRRAFVHSSFAMVEGICFYWRCMLIDILPISPGLFSEREQEDLRKMTEIAGNKHYSPNELVKFTLIMLAKAVGEPSIDFNSESRWNKLISAIAVRNRITHPKFESGLEISNEEIEDLQAVFLWYSEKENIYLTKFLTLPVSATQ